MVVAYQSTLYLPYCVKPLATANAGLIDSQVHMSPSSPFCRVESDRASRCTGVPPSIGREGECLKPPRPLNLARPPQLWLLRGAWEGQQRASELHRPAGLLGSTSGCAPLGSYPTHNLELSLPRPGGQNCWGRELLMWPFPCLPRCG